MSVIYLAKGAHGTTAIEGNPLTEEQVQRHIQGQLELPKSQEYQQREIDNIVRVANEIVEQMHSEDKGITAELVCDYNAQVLANLELEPHVAAGSIRKMSVEVNRYLCPPPEDCDFLLSRYCHWLNSDQFSSHDKSKVYPLAILKAVLAHLYLAWIHPFGDGNGRTARLLELYILIRAGIPSLSAHLFSNYYMLTRETYYRKLDEARDNIEPFLVYAVRGFTEQLDEQLQEIQVQQWRVSWTDYIYEVFETGGSAAQRRRRHLLLDMPWQKRCQRRQIKRISPRVAEEYAGKTAKTVTRDLNALTKAGLLDKSSEGYRPRWELILGFLPQRRLQDLKEHEDT